MASTCPVGCSRSVKFGHLMCGACWRKVPKDVQTRVYRSWRAVQAGRPDAMTDYDAAKADAIAWADGTLVGP